VVDLEHPSADQRKLVARFTTGYIPTLSFLDPNGNVVYDRAGETARERGHLRVGENLSRSFEALISDVGRGWSCASSAVGSGSQSPPTSGHGRNHD
jgi:hypothetical protein